MSVCCSHGWAVDKESVEAVLKFKAAFKPHHVVHMGDAFDMTAYRTNAAGHKDEYANIDADWSAGVQLFEQLEIDAFLCGNHEFRIYRLQQAASAIVSKHAHDACEQLEKAVKRHKAKFYPYDIKKGWHRIGDLHICHGFKCGKNALEWHAHHVGGDVAMGHIHTCEDRQFEGLGGRRGFVVGMLANSELLEYAQTWPTRSRWQNGFLWGEYNDKYTIANLCRRHEHAGWKLPIV